MRARRTCLLSAPQAGPSLRARTARSAQDDRPRLLFGGGRKKNSGQAVGYLGQLISQRPRHPPRVTLIDHMARDQAAEVVGIHASSEVVASGNRAERARVVVEPGGLVDRRRLGRALAK